MYNLSDEGANVMGQMMPDIEEYPLFSSLHKALAEGEEYEEWLESIPFEVLEAYTNHEVWKSKKKKDKLIDQDFMATIMVFNNLENDNKPIDENQITKNIRCFQMILTALWFNKKLEVEFGTNVPAFFLEDGSWKNCLDIVVRRNEEINWEDKSGKGKK